jgi:hypothetical protein
MNGNGRAPYEQGATNGRRRGPVVGDGDGDMNEATGGHAHG